MRLRIDDVSVALGGCQALAGVDMTVEPGEIIGIVGPNGSGKTTLLRTVYRALRPDSGVCYLDGDDVWALSGRQAARRVAVVAQEQPTEFAFKVRDIVLMGRTPHQGVLDRDTAGDHAIVQAALEQVGAAHLSARVYTTLSGGEKQRTLVARALAQQSPLLLLDEPTNHLDVHHQLDILDLVRRLELTVLTTLHDLNLAAQWCDRVSVLDRGRIVAAGTPEQALRPEIVEQVYRVKAVAQRHPVTGAYQLAFTRLGEPAAAGTSPSTPPNRDFGAHAPLNPCSDVGVGD